MYGRGNFKGIEIIYYEHMEHYVDRVMDKVRVIFEDSMDQSVAHRWKHAYRVMKRAVILAERLDKSIDVEVLQISALLHDIDQPFNGKEEHVERSVSKAEEILEDIGYPKDKTLKVLEIIKQHSSEGKIDITIEEAKILFDADKLDGVGAIGIARVFSLCGQNGLTPDEAIEWYKRKIEKVSPFLQTSIGMDVAEEKLRYVEDFFRRYYEEEEKLL